MIGVAALMAMTSCDNPTYPGGDNGNTDGKEEAQGQVSLSQLSIKVNVSDIEMGSRAANVEDLSKYTINIKRVNRASESGNQSFLYGEMPELVALPVGQYVVEAYNAEEQVAEFDAPFIYGKSKQFSVVANDIVVVDPIECTLRNVKVSIAYTDELRSRMSDVAVTVTVADTETLVFSGDETRSGYFKYVEGNKTIVAEFSGKIDGTPVTSYKVITNAVAPGYHHTITFSLKDSPNPPDEYGTIGTTGVSLDATVDRVDLNGNVSLGDEEIIEPDAPKEYLTVGADALSFGCAAEQKTVQVKASHEWTVESSAPWCTVTKTTSGISVDVAANSDPANDRTATITVTMNKLTSTIAVTQAKYTEAPQGPTFESEYIDLWSGAYNNISEFGADKKPAVVVISAPKGIKNLHVTISSATLEPLLDGMLETQFDLATGLSDAGNDLTTALAGLHFPVASGGTYETQDENGNPVTETYGPVLNQTTVNFDITTFMNLMAKDMIGASASSTPKHDFIVTVTDNDGNEATATIRFQSDI